MFKEFFRSGSLNCLITLCGQIPTNMELVHKIVKLCFPANPFVGHSSRYLTYYYLCCNSMPILNIPVHGIISSSSDLKKMLEAILLTISSGHWTAKGGYTR